MASFLSPAYLARAAALASSLISHPVSAESIDSKDGNNSIQAAVQTKQGSSPSVCNLPPQESTLFGADLDYAIASASAAIMNYARNPDKYNPPAPLLTPNDVPSAFAGLMDAKRKDGTPLLQSQSDIDQVLSGGYQEALNIFPKSQEKLMAAAKAGNDELKTLMMFEQSERNGPGGCENPSPAPPLINMSEYRMS